MDSDLLGDSDADATAQVHSSSLQNDMAKPQGVTLQLQTDQSQGETATSHSQLQSQSTAPDAAASLVLPSEAAAAAGVEELSCKALAVDALSGTGEGSKHNAPDGHVQVTLQKFSLHAAAQHDR